MSAEIQISVRIRPGPSPVIDVIDGTHVGLVASASSRGSDRESFGYLAHVVKGSDQGVAYDALAGQLVDKVWPSA